MRSIQSIFPIALIVVASSCSQPDPESASLDQGKSATSDIDRSEVGDTAGYATGENAMHSTQTLVPPDLEPTGPVHESPGVVDNREAQIAFDLLQMEDGTAKYLALTELFQRWSKDDLSAAMGFLPYVVEDMETKRAFFRGVAPELLEQDPEWLLEISEEHWWQGNWEATMDALSRVSDSNLDLAVKFFSNTVEGKKYPPMAGEIAGKLMDARSLEEAEAFARSIDRPVAQGAAIQAIVTRRTKQDPIAATNYVNSISDLTLRDYAIRGMLQEAADESPVEALAWTRTMQEGNVRLGTVKMLIRKWNGTQQQKSLEELAAFGGLSNEERGLLRDALED